MNNNEASLIRESKVWNQEFKNWDEILDKGILMCEYIPDEKKALIILLRTGKLIEEIMEKILERYDLSIAQKSVLESLYFSKTEYLTQSELSKYIFTSKANVSTLLSRMENKGLIARKESKISKREKLVIITPKGTEILERLINDLKNKDTNLFKNENSAKQLYQELIIVREKLKSIRL